jgi:hypothetical protein
MARPRDHIAPMSGSYQKRSENGSARAPKLGRSSLTGQFILKPVGKKGGATLSQVRDATRTVIRTKKD